MDWFKDKENRPMVITIGVGLIAVIIAAIIILKPGAGNNASSPNGTVGMPPGGMSGRPGAMPGGAAGVPGMPGAPGAMGGAAGMAGAPGAMGGYPGDMSGAGQVEAAPAEAVVAANPMEPWRNDPFMPLGYKPRIKSKNIRPKISDFPFMQVNKFPQESESGPVETPQPARRMSGILMNSRLYAIIETDGKSEIVRPGDTLKDGLAIVQSVERDRIILKTTGPRSRTIEVRLAAAPKTQTGNYGGAGVPGMGGPGMPPGMGAAGGMGPGGMPPGAFGGGGAGMPPPPPGL